MSFLQRFSLKEHSNPEFEEFLESLYDPLVLLPFTCFFIYELEVILAKNGYQNGLLVSESLAFSGLALFDLLLHLGAGSGFTSSNFWVICIKRILENVKELK